ncbi:MAG: hypothetical protein WBA16_12030 [Nonlabens sp.]
MARAMFEYTKTILEKVSFDATLFCRELEKAILRLLPYEVIELQIWIKQFITINPELATCVALPQKK